MTSDILDNDSSIIRKKIKLEIDHIISASDCKRKITPSKIESNSSNSYQFSTENSKDIMLKVYPVLNFPEESKSSQNAVRFFVTNYTNLCSKDDNVQEKCSSDNVRSTKFASEGVANIRPSEALFVRCLLPHCKRLAPLWFKGVSSMREKNREEHRRISASTTSQNQEDWEQISDRINEMNESTETETVVNLLKKLYKELPADTVLWFIKCWLKFPETLVNEDKCAFTRGDARSRMRRIDGGKGSDKVWRLDTIVGMMFHGMPMSSTDTNIMVHTCDQELCIRPQHLRFRASSVAFVAVLKALQQTGYTIIPPPEDNYSVNGGNVSPSDEFVDLSGPFKIEQLQQYRLEDLKPYEQSIGKLNCSSSDNSLLDIYPILKNYYPLYGNNFQKAMEDYKSRRNSTGNNNNRRMNELKRPAQTTSNSTDSPPQTSDGNSHQCHSPPHLSSVKSLNTEIAPTPRKVEMNHSYRIGNFKMSSDSPSSSIFSNGREKESIGQAPDLLAEEPYDYKFSTTSDSFTIIPRVATESPIICGSNNGSGKNTPRQPAKKRLEARTPTFLVEEQPDTLSTVSSQLDTKLTGSNNNISAFKVVSKKNIITNDEQTEVEVAKIFEPSIEFKNGSCHSSGSFLSETTDVANTNMSNLRSSDNSLSSHTKATDQLTTPSPLDYLFMAISQNHNLSVADDPMALPDNGTGSPIKESRKTPSMSNESSLGYRMPHKSSSAAVSCRFTPEQASALFNVIRNSPYGNNNPEIIDILFNMMQQYPCVCDSSTGDHYHRPDSQLLRCQIYQQLSKASPQFDCDYSSPITNGESISLRSSPFQNPTNKVIFNHPSNAPKSKIFFTEN